MKILIDLVHPADVNFYKNAYKLLSKRHRIYVTVMDRAGLPEFARQEFGSVEIIGRHSKKGWKKPYYNLKRVFELRSYIKSIKPDVVTSFSYYPAAAAKGLGVKSVVFHDDPEYKIQFILCRLFADKLILPDFLKIKGKNIKTYPSYKEWAYLKDFRPDYSVLKGYRLSKYKYVFIREVAKVSLNYRFKKERDLQALIDLLAKKYKVVLSLEDKTIKYKNCIILKEPVKNFHSLLYYSKAVVSSGDTMAREAALLGVPSIYTGGRDMRINREMVKFKHIIPLSENKDILDAINISKRRDIMINFEDTTRIIIQSLLER